jgi:N-acetylmuramoyl-L-alanine amidase
MMVRLMWCAAVACLVVLGGVLPAAAETQLYRATVGGVRYAPEAAIYYASEVAYVSLFDVAGQIGGSGKLLSDTEAEVLAAGGRAVVTFNAAEVAVGESRFTLKQPVLRYEDQALIARDEAAAFFDNAFAVALLPVRDGEMDDPALLEEMGGAPVEATPAEGAPAAPAALPSFDTVVIDPGHGGADAGTVGPGGTNEKDLALAVALRLRDALRESGGLTVHLTREEDRDLTLLERVSLITQHPGAVVISLHTGASLSPGAHGVEVFTPAPGGAADAGMAARSKGLAEAIAGTVPGRVETPFRGIRPAPLRLYRETGLPGVLVEMGCLTNPAEESLMKTESYQRLMAQGLAEGLRAAAGGAS